MGFGYLSGLLKCRNRDGNLHHAGHAGQSLSHLLIETFKHESKLRQKRSYDSLASLFISTEDSEHLCIPNLLNTLILNVIKPASRFLLPGFLQVGDTLHLNKLLNI